VAQFTLNWPQETINLTITELGARVGVSEASIVRFAQSLGYTGFHALNSPASLRIGVTNDSLHLFNRCAGIV
jgi:DNA-binding MurR/RpiR family transcriptional regulator